MIPRSDADVSCGLRRPIARLEPRLLDALGAQRAVGAPSTVMSETRI